MLKLFRGINRWRSRIQPSSTTKRGNNSKTFHNQSNPAQYIHNKIANSSNSNRIRRNRSLIVRTVQSEFEGEPCEPIERCPCLWRFRGAHCAHGFGTRIPPIR